MKRIILFVLLSLSFTWNYTEGQVISKNMALVM